MTQAPTAIGASPPWFEAERHTRNLHALVRQLGRSDLVLTVYRIGDGLGHLADLGMAEAPASGATAAVTSVARTHAGAWRIQVRCPRCGGLHVHGGGLAPLPEFGRRTPPCDGAPYWLWVDART